MLLIGIEISNLKKKLCPSVGLEYPLGTTRQAVSNIIIVGLQNVRTFP